MSELIHEIKYIGREIPVTVKTVVELTEEQRRENMKACGKSPMFFMMMAEDLFSCCHEDKTATVFADPSRGIVCQIEEKDETKRYIIDSNQLLAVFFNSHERQSGSKKALIYRKSPKDKWQVIENADEDGEIIHGECQSIEAAKALCDGLCLDYKIEG